MICQQIKDTKIPIHWEVKMEQTFKRGDWVRQTDNQGSAYLPEETARLKAQDECNLKAFSNI